MSLRARIFLIISIAVLIVLAVSIFLIVRNKRNNETPGPSGSTPTTSPGAAVLPSGQTPTEIPAGTPVKTAAPLEIEKNGVEQLAKVFVERYGTYSTDNESQNIIESEPLVTKSLWEKISVAINRPVMSQVFYGITTKVISTNITSWSDTKATVSLQTRRTEGRDGGPITTRSQNVTVEMVKQDTVWLANDIVWN